LKSGTRNLEPGIIYKYFPDLTTVQARQFDQLGQLYSEWNAKINVISRKDIENLYERHVLHSLSIAKLLSFLPGMDILDAGTGGGFPGIPLAIIFPEAHFHLVDSTAKKLSVVEAVASSAGIRNITTEHCRFENHNGKYDFIVSRAVASLDLIAGSLYKNIRKNGNAWIPNGILYLKGGELREELDLLNQPYRIYELSGFFSEEFFQTKKLVHIYQV
jgi:16S rRNA (guanine527-N7)-methyltransferase